MLGVLAGLEETRTLKGSLKSPLEVIVFDDEEDTMRGSIGYTKDKPDIKAFLEVHVEQGPVLDVQQLDIGVVTVLLVNEDVHSLSMVKRTITGTTPMK